MARRLPETRYAQSSGAKIAYQVSGTGPPDLVMVPGLVSHLNMQWQQTGYRRFVRALERGGCVIRLDKRGTGLSDPAGDLPTTQERVRDLAAVMAAAKSSRAVLFGLSDGGRAAIAFAAAYPGRAHIPDLMPAPNCSPQAGQRHTQAASGPASRPAPPGRCHPAVGDAAGPGGAPAAKRFACEATTPGHPARLGVSTHTEAAATVHRMHVPDGQ